MYDNPGIDFETCYSKWFDDACSVCLPAVCARAYDLCNKSTDLQGEIASLLRGITCLDLTALSGDNTYTNLQRLCYKAVNPIKKETLLKLGFDKDLSCASVCVHPSNVPDCVEILNSMESSLPVAAVGAGFPSAQTYMLTKSHEIIESCEYGAKEIDMVISRDLVLGGKWKELYEEIKLLRRETCSCIKLKTIIGAGELGSLSNVYKASLICMAAGADFIKTSTGKECVNATYPIGVVMARAINAYYLETGYKIGFKPAGGIRKARDVLKWQNLMRYELGKEWLFPDLFRIGASGLLGDIEIYLTSLATNGRDRAIPYL